MADNMKTVMPKKLAQALMEAGMHHFDAGGQQLSSGGNPYGTAANDFRNGQIGNGIVSGSNPAEAINGIGQGVQGLGQMFTATNNYQAQAPGISTQSFQPIQGLLDQNQSTYNQQQNLANTLLQQSQGKGPNPAQAQLAQNTGNNIAAQGALMAGQRGASSNPGLMARQIAQNGAQTQQNATGQAATLQAQQQLNNQAQLQSLYGNMAGQSLQGQGILQGALAAQNSAITTGQLGAEQINANVAGQNAAAQNATTGGIMGALGGGGASMLNKGGKVQKMADGGIASYQTPTNPNITLSNYAGPSQSQSMASGAKAGKSLGKYLKGKMGSSDLGPPVAQDSDLAGGPSDAGSTDSGMLTAAYGGKIPHFDDGGDVEDSGDIGSLKSDESNYTPSTAPVVMDNYATPSAPGGGGTSNMGAGVGGAWAKPSSGGGASGIASIAALFSKGGNIPFSTHLLQGGSVPGKAQVKGDSPKNDTQFTLLSPGEEVLPRSITMAKDAPERAAEFVRHLQAKKKGGYGDVVSAKKSLKERVEHLEKCMGGKI